MGKVSNLDDIARRYILAKEKYEILHEEIVKKIVELGDVKKLATLVENYDIRIEAFKYHLNACSDEVLAFILRETEDIDIAFRCIKFTGDRKKLLEFSNDHILENFEEDNRKKLSAVAKKIHKSLNNKLVFYPELRLENGDKNKFIVGIHEKSNDMHIACSNTEDCQYHKDIFSRIGGNFPEELRSGGYVRFQQESKNIVNFFSSSGDFGCYNHKILNSRKKDIEKELSSQYGCKVDLKIEISR